MGEVRLDLNKLRFALQNRVKAKMDAGNAIPSAVLLLLYEKEGKEFVLFTLRTFNVEHHKGQISFPGGVFQNSDRDLVETALREAEEEIGVKPEDVTLLGELDPVLTRSNFLITPFVASIPYPYPFVISPEEVAEVIEVPLKHLLEEKNYWKEIEPSGRIVHFFKYEDKIIWGATALILKQFLEIALSCLRQI